MSHFLRTGPLNKKNYQAHGSPLQALAGIKVHLDVLLDDTQKAHINWHDDQDISIAVMRALSAWSDDRDRVAELEM